MSPADHASRRGAALVEHAQDKPSPVLVDRLRAELVTLPTAFIVSDRMRTVSSRTVAEHLHGPRSRRYLPHKATRRVDFVGKIHNRAAAQPFLVVRRRRSFALFEQPDFSNLNIPGFLTLKRM